MMAGWFSVSRPSRRRQDNLPGRRGGTLSNNKGINRQGGGLSAQALTDKDREILLSPPG